VLRLRRIHLAVPTHRHPSWKDRTMADKDEKNLAQVLKKIEGMKEPERSVMLRMHEVIVAAAPELKPRIW